MIKEYLNGTKLGIIACLFEKIEGVHFNILRANLPRSAKNAQSELDILVEDGVVVCEETPEGKIYHGNTKSRIFIGLFNIDMKLSDREYIRKKKLRARLFAPQKK